MPHALRSLQAKTGVTVRTAKGSTVYSPNDPANNVNFSNPQTAQGGPFVLLNAPGSGLAWVITSLWITTGPAIQITFSNGLSFSLTAGSFQQVITGSPFTLPSNTHFTYSYTVGSGSGTVSPTGSAYILGAGSSAPTPGMSQFDAVPIDSDPAGDLG